MKYSPKIRSISSRAGYKTLISSLQVPINRPFNNIYRNSSRHLPPQQLQLCPHVRVDPPRHLRFPIRERERPVRNRLLKKLTQLFPAPLDSELQQFVLWHQWADVVVVSAKESLSGVVVEALPKIFNHHHPDGRGEADRGPRQGGEGADNDVGSAVERIDGGEDWIWMRGIKTGDDGMDSHMREWG